MLLLLLLLRSELIHIHARERYTRSLENRWCWFWSGFKFFFSPLFHSFSLFVAHELTESHSVFTQLHDRRNVYTHIKRSWHIKTLHRSLAPYIHMHATIINTLKFVDANSVPFRYALNTASQPHNNNTHRVSDELRDSKKIAYSHEKHSINIDKHPAK